MPNKAINEEAFFVRCEAPQEKLTSFLIREVSNDKKTFDRYKDQGGIESQ